MDKLECKIHLFLLSQHFLITQMGFKYLIDAIAIYCRLKKPIKMTSQVYLPIARKHGTSLNTVINTIKNSIEYAILRCNNEDTLLMKLQSEVTGSVRCGEFISYAAGCLDLQG